MVRVYNVQLPLVPNRVYRSCPLGKHFYDSVETAVSKKTAVFVTLSNKIDKRQAVLTPQSHNFKPAESVTVVVDLNLPAGTRT